MYLQVPHDYIRKEYIMKGNTYDLHMHYRIANYWSLHMYGVTYDHMQDTAMIFYRHIQVARHIRYHIRPRAGYGYDILSPRTGRYTYTVSHTTTCGIWLLYDSETYKYI